MMVLYKAEGSNEPLQQTWEKMYREFFVRRKIDSQRPYKVVKEYDLYYWVNFEEEGLYAAPVHKTFFIEVPVEVDLNRFL